MDLRGRGQAQLAAALRSTAETTLRTARVPVPPDPRSSSSSVGTTVLRHRRRQPLRSPAPTAHTTEQQEQQEQHGNDGNTDADDDEDDGRHQQEEGDAHTGAADPPTHLYVAADWDTQNELAAAVRRLPDSLEALPPEAARRAGQPSAALPLEERLQRNRLERHRAALQKYQADLAAVREAIEVRLRLASAALRAQLDSGAQRLDQLFTQASARPEALLQLAFEQLQHQWEAIQNTCRERQALIGAFLDQALALEEERRQSLLARLRDAHKLLVAVAHTLPPEVEQWAMQETLRLSAELSQNRCALADLKARLLAREIQLERGWSIHWERQRDAWRLHHVETTVARINAACSNPAHLKGEIHHRLELLRAGQAAAVQQLVACLRSLGKLSSTDAVTALRKGQGHLLQLHEQCADQLERLLEELDDHCGSKRQEGIAHLVNHRVLALEQATALVLQRCRPVADAELAAARNYITELQSRLQQGREALTTATEELLSLLSTLEKSLRLVQRQHAAERDAIRTRLAEHSGAMQMRRAPPELDIDEDIDALRQAGTKESLTVVQARLLVRLPGLFCLPNTRRRKGRRGIGCCLPRSHGRP
jgi:hypothetical protein